MNGRNWIFLIFLSNSNIFILQHIISIKIDPRTLLKQLLVTTKLFVVTGLQIE